MTQHRKFGVDCLRGLAILLVIVHHLALPFRLPLTPSLLGDWLPRRLLCCFGLALLIDWAYRKRVVTMRAFPAGVSR